MSRSVNAATVAVSSSLKNAPYPGPCACAWAVVAVLSAAGCGGCVCAIASGTRPAAAPAPTAAPIRNARRPSSGLLIYRFLPIGPLWGTFGIGGFGLLQFQTRGCASSPAPTSSWASHPDLSRSRTFPDLVPTANPKQLTDARECLFVQAAWVLVKVKPNRWAGHGLKPWIEAAKKRLHHNVLAIAKFSAGTRRIQERSTRCARASWQARPNPGD